jgi:transposase
MRASFEARITELEQRVRDLEAQLKQNSSNSSRPPSSDPPQAPQRSSKPPTGRKPGGQPGHPGHARTRLPPERVNQIVDYWPSVCERCQGPLPQAPQDDDPEPTWHQVAEVPLSPALVMEHQAHGSHCPDCGHCTWSDPSRLRARIPADVRAHVFGPNLTALVAYLSVFCRGSKRIIEEFIETVFQIPLSLGTVANLEQETSAALREPYQEAQQNVRAAAVKNTDETGWRQAGQRRWLWLAATQTVACFKVCVGRGKAALRELLGEAIQGIVSSDRWSAYNQLELFCRQLCWAHLKRDFQKWIDRGGVAGLVIGQAGAEATRRIFALWRDFRERRMDRSVLQAALLPVQEELRAALETGASCDDVRVRRFCRNVLAVYPALWTFARVEGVEPTNNHAERTLRRAVIWRKVSFGNHSDAGCRFTERILTVVQTLRMQHRPVLDYLRQALLAHRTAGPSPVLCAVGA